MPQEWYAQPALLNIFNISGTRCYGLYTYNGSESEWDTKIASYFAPKPFFGSTATKYGQIQEKHAKNAYRQHIADWSEVIDYGLAVCPNNSWLACSPDGVVLQNSRPVRLLEIKCPVAGMIFHSFLLLCIHTKFT